MAISQEAIQGQDCSLVFETATVTLPFVNWDSSSWQERKVQSQFVTAQSTVTKFTNPRKEILTFRIRGKRGTAETYKDLKVLLDTEELTDIQMTDFPDFADLVAEYGPASVQMIGADQPNEFGTYEIEVAFGKITTGYTEV